MTLREFTSISDEVLASLVEKSVPLFAFDDIELASPTNASPYPISRQQFTRFFGFNPARQTLIRSLLRTVDLLATRCDVHSALIGGSLLRKTIAAPRDIDGVVFYSISHPEPDIGAFLSAVLATGRNSNVDLRLVPTDAAQSVLVRSACFFSNLYACEKGGSDHQRGSVLLIEEDRHD